MADWFVGPVLEKLISAGFEYLKDQVRWQTGMKEELQRLRENQPKIQAIVHASSQAQISDQNPALSEWLWQLRDAIDEVDDVLDELEYIKVKKQVTQNMEETKVRSAMSFLEKGFVKIGKRALKIDQSLKRLEEAVQKLDKISVGVDTFFHLVKDARQEQQEQQLELFRARETGSLPKNDQIGRAKDRAYVTQWLRKPSNEYQTTLYSNISLLSIVGVGGMGKTTLLQHVYKDEMTKEFDLKMWVCVSNNFDANRVIADMLESLKNERPRLEKLDALQKSLMSAVKSQKFLLVLDDIWEEDEEQDKSKWENVFAPLASAKLGSKVLVTTRMESVALMIANVINKKSEKLILEGLKEDDCLLLLNRYAFANVENPNVHHNLRFITEKIVKRLSGSPLAARVTGGILNSRLDESHWLRVLQYNIGSQNDISSILNMSYIFLPKPLQNCLAFCGIFQQDYKFDKDDLIRMWIALGFIQPLYIQGETVKDAGERYFDVLVKKSLFDKFQIKDKTYYKLHDLLHESLISISRQECFSIVGDEKLLFRIPETIRHLFVDTSDLNLLKKMGKLKNLRSLYLSYSDDCEDFIDVLTEIFKTSRSIRLMYIYAPCLKQVPEEIGNLIHLRYLKIFNTPATLLPRYLSNLYHLQFMIYDQDFVIQKNLDDIFLRSDMNNLPNLHYLKLPFPGMHGIGNFNSLQELDGFYIKDEDGYRIGQLEHMNELRLLIINLIENVKDAEEACNAKLYDKRNLTDLSLIWRHSKLSNYLDITANGDIILRDFPKSIANADLDEKVLDNLRPPNGLKKLKIDSFMGARSAIWMSSVHLIPKLEYIQLEDCLEWQILPPFWQLPLLKSLYLRNMPKVKGFDNKSHGNDKLRVFPSLQVLFIKNLEVLEDWFVATEETYECLFPCLTELYLQNCPNLQQLPSLPSKLENLELDGIGWKGSNWLHGICNNCNISISGCPNLISLKGHQEVENAENFQLILSELIINDPSLLLMVPLRTITSIQKLEIKGNDAVVSFPKEAKQWFLQVSSSLCELNFIRLKSLQSLPSSLENLSSLKTLRVEKAPQLQLLPNIPASLERLVLEVLDSLQCLPSSLFFSSLKHLKLTGIPLENLPNLPSSLCTLKLSRLWYIEFIDLSSCLPSLSSLKELVIDDLPQLRKLPDLPHSLKSLSIKNCHPELNRRYQKFVRR